MIRGRVTELVAGVGAVGVEAPVPTCPGWRVRDVIGHLVGNVEDAAPGRLTGPPSQSVTAEQVKRHHDDDIDNLLTAWERLAPPFEAMISAGVLWPAAIDLVSHEHDIRHALDRPGARDDPVVGLVAELMAAGLADRVEVVVHGAPHRARPLIPQLRVSSFELLRLAMGRRTVAQVAALDWSGDPTDVLSGLFVFGPATEPIVE